MPKMKNENTRSKCWNCKFGLSFFQTSHETIEQELHGSVDGDATPDEEDGPQWKPDKIRKGKMSRTQTGHTSLCFWRPPGLKRTDNDFVCEVGYVTACNRYTPEKGIKSDK